MPREKSESAKEKARRARKASSAAESIMWGYLRNRNTGFKFRREHPIGPYRLDFFCPEAMLAVEMDGEQHSAERDAVRDAFLMELGITTYRISNRRFFEIDDEPFRNEIAVIAKLCEARVNRPSPPAPSPQRGEGKRIPQNG